MRSLKAGLMAAIAMATVGGAGVAHAQLVPLYGGGATFPSKALRLLGDCYMAQLNAGGNGTTDVAAATLPYDANCNGGAGFGATGIFHPADDGARIGVMLYAPVGSGAGKTAFRTHAMVPAPATSNLIAFSDSRDPALGFAGGGVGYPGGHMHFIGSDDVVNATDYNVGATSYVGNGNKAAFGEWIQIPELIGPVTIAFNGTDASGAALPLPVDANGKPILKLSRKAFCGIFSGHIQKWNNATLVADNPALAGVAAANALIKVVHRSDGSGTSFLFSNALSAQCSSSTGGHAPFGVDDTSGKLVSYEFPWADQNASFATVGSSDYSCNTPAPVAGAPANALPLEGANLLGWPDFSGVGGAGNDICGTSIANPMAPAPTNFHGFSGNGGVEGAMDTAKSGAAANGTIGYLTPDFAYPIVPAGIPVAQLQNDHDLGLGIAGSFVSPTAAAATITMASAVPPSSSDPNFSNPLTWSAALTVPNPTAAGAYPIAGFTNFGFYQCYASADTLQTLFAYIKFHYGVTHGGVASSILNGQGFAPVPGTTSSGWLGAIASLVTAAAPMEVGPVAGTCTSAD